MSSHATYNVPYDMNERDRRKKAFIQRRKRKRLLVVLSFFVCIIVLVALIVLVLVNFLKKRNENNAEKMAYVDYEGEYKDIWLVDNSFNMKGTEGTFFEIEEPEDNTDVESDRKEKYKNIAPGSKGVVIVDAGHGGYDGGADGNGLLEKDLNLDISYKLKDELELRGYYVTLTRPDDEFVGLTQRASIANSLEDPVCFISIHQNSLDDSEGIAFGMESWTYERDGCKELGDFVVEAAAIKTGARNRGTHFRKNLVVTSKTTMPAIIFECGYITDADEAEKLADEDYQDLLAEGIADGIENFRDSYYG